MVIDVPAESQLHQQIVRKDFEATDIFINPATRIYYIESGINSISSANIEKTIKRFFDTLAPTENIHFAIFLRIIGIYKSNTGKIENF